MHDTPQDVHQQQQEDLTQFGRLIFALCCGNLGASSGPHFQKSIDHLVRFYGQDMKSLALWLISKGTVKVCYSCVWVGTPRMLMKPWIEHR